MSDFNDVVDLVYSIRNKELLADFLVGLTTAKEQAELIQRVEIIKKLIAGQPQHQIAHDLGVGIATVTRGSKELAQGRFRALRRQDEKN